MQRVLVFTWIHSRLVKDPLILDYREDPESGGRKAAATGH